MNLLEVTHLSRHYGDFIAVEDISFSLKAGELLALIGPNGAGKSTTFNMIGGQLAVTRGQVLLEGKPVTNLPARRIWKKGVGRTFQIAATFGSFTVAQNVQNALLSYHGRSYSFWQSADRLYRDQADALLEQVGMRSQADRHCSELAYGDVKRVELAMALASEPRLLLMDEPTAGMAPQERQDLMALTRDIARARNTGVLFTEHSMDVVFGFADRILVLARGQLIAQGTPQEIRNHPQVQQVYFGRGTGLPAESGRRLTDAQTGMSPPGMNATNTRDR